MGHLAECRLTLENGPKGDGRLIVVALLEAMMLVLSSVVLVVVGGREDGAPGIELFNKHGLDYKSEWHSRILNCVHEELRREIGTVYVTAYSAFLLLCNLPIMFHQI